MDSGLCLGNWFMRWQKGFKAAKLFLGEFGPIRAMLIGMISCVAVPFEEQRLRVCEKRPGTVRAKMLCLWHPFGFSLDVWVSGYMDSLQGGHLSKGDVTLVNLQRRLATHVFRTNLQTCYTFESLSKISNTLQHCKYRTKSSATGCYTRTIFCETSYHCKLALQVDQCNTTLKQTVAFVPRVSALERVDW